MHIRHGTADMLRKITPLSLLLLLALASSCGEEGGAELSGEGERRNVVLVLLESTRASAVTPYNQDLATTPYLDELSESSLMAETAYSTVPSTSKSLIAAECGTEPPLTMQIPRMLDSGGLPRPCLAELLREEGYNTVFYENATEEFEDRGELVKSFGYEDFYPLEYLEEEGYTEGFERANYFGYEDDVLLQPSREWLRDNSSEPFLATYETITPHDQYLAPDRYGHKDFSEDDEFDRYLNSVRYLDFFIKNLMDQYKELGLYEDTVFVFYGDHGEGFGEHGMSGHGHILYEEGTRIPLIVHDPGRFESGERVREPVSQLDIAPTVLDLLGYEVPGEYPGVSLFRPPGEQARERALNFSCAEDEQCLARLEGGEKYIHDFDEPDELYDLSEDPQEENDLAGNLSEAEKEERRSELLRWREKNAGRYGE